MRLARVRLRPNLITRRPRPPRSRSLSWFMSAPQGTENDPPHRLVRFDDDPEILGANQLLRQAWRTNPPPKAEESRVEEAGDSAGIAAGQAWVMQFVSEDAARSLEERAAVPLNPDKDDTHTSWPKHIYTMWLYLFAANGLALEHVDSNIGHWHFESVVEDPQGTYGQLVLYHNQRLSSSLRTTFDRNVLLLPAYIDPGFCAKVDWLPTEGGSSIQLDEQCEMGMWKENDQGSIWYVRRDVPLEMSVQPVEGSSKDGERTGVAAVFMYALLCTKNCRSRAAEGEEAAPKGE